MYGYATGAYPPTPHETPCVNRPPSLPGDRGNFSGVLPQRESECTMSNEKPIKRASVTPPENTFGIWCRPRNWLVPVILLSLREWNSYGYELMARASIFGFEAMNTGTLYRTLRRMEKDGVVESSWDLSGGGPARRMYAITGSGNAHLDIWVKSLERYRHSVDAFFELYGGKPPHASENEYD
jgi:PadR family transcriptional regulator, regulatory protein PadR